VSDTHALRAERAGRDVSSEAQAVWWVPLVLGGCWLVFALLVFRLDATSVHGISILFGVVCVAGAAVELAEVGTASGGWRIVRALLGVAFFVIGILAFLHPGDSFAALATIFAFYLLLRGLFDIGAALFSRQLDLWWVGLVTGAVQVALAFWAAGDFGHKAILLVVWVGASALLAGIRQIVFAFQLRGERS
jgi:uncharacterized membrane protein HdeD (DUF308 family)